MVPRIRQNPVPFWTLAHTLVWFPSHLLVRCLGQLCSQSRHRASFEHLRWNIQRNNATNVVPLHAALVAPEHRGQQRVLVAAPDGYNTGGATLHVRSLREAEAEAASAMVPPPTESRAAFPDKNIAAVASVLGTWATMPVRTVALDDAPMCFLWLALVLALN